ncbi:fibronectin type III domain-containing protein [Actinomadura xylanilytica]|uniref:fibronectin type III domain-containing protein n=1 Tax=Actinomadura xylanilytica TaxID=887459 RepID=UPI00255AFB56|nr:fibronectin type III domain-containing protein [Actinomadura xylanilytica]MDL4774649.1 fibronectin type III domain-containing protein [Actinomadura xylanilytica]
MSGDRSPGRTGRPRGFFRRDRLTGQIAIGLVGVLCVSALVYGVGTASARYRISDVGSWLSASAKGLVVHANGLAGKVDGKAAVIPRMRGHKIKIVQDGTTVLLVDETTGVVSRIDPSQLKVAQSKAVGGAGLQVLAGAGVAYTVDAVKGTVQQIDPLNLNPVGQGTTLSPPLSQAGIDAGGTLWVPAPQTGQLVPFQNGRQGRPVAAGRGGDRLGLTIAAGTPVVTNSTAATALIVRPEGTQKINLPPAVTGAAGGVKVPAVADGGTVPMLGAGGSLYLLDTGVGQVRSVSLRMPKHRYEPPNVLGPRVYLADRTAGHLLVFNIVSGGWETPIQATRPGGTIEVVVRDHMLWVNDPNGALAFALDAGGARKRIQKYDDKIPGGRRRPIPTQARPGDGRGGQNNTGGQGHGGGTPGGPRPPAPPPPKKDPTAPDPPTPSAIGENGRVQVSFTPVSQPQGVYPVTAYVLLDASDRPVAGAQPARIASNAPQRTFTVGGLACDRTSHAYKVAAEYRGKDGKARLSPSGEVAATACQAPTVTPALTVTPKNHGADLSWTKVTGYAVKYVVTRDGAASPEQTRTTADVGGLTNGTGKTYTFTVTARNGAGETTSAGKAADLDPANHAHTYNGHNNGSTQTILHTGAGKSAPKAGEFPRGFTGSVKVICQVTDDQVVDENNTSLKSKVWSKIDYSGIKWVSDLYVTTPNSNAGKLSAPTVWGCT